MISIALYDSGSESFLDLFEKTQLYFTTIDNKQYSISCFNNAKHLLASKSVFDIYIIDVTTKDDGQLEGLTIGQTIFKSHPNARIIYVCDIEAYEKQDAADMRCAYLRKPMINVEKLYNQFDAIINDLKPKRALVPISGLEDAVIPIDEIAYIDIERRNLCFHFKDGSKVTSVAIRSAFTKEVSRFINVKNLFFATSTLLVNLDYIKTLAKNKITFKNDQELYTTEKAIKLIKEEIYSK